jgi:hypothetical protein
VASSRAAATMHLRTIRYENRSRRYCRGCRPGTTLSFQIDLTIGVTTESMLSGNLHAAP